MGTTVIGIDPHKRSHTAVVLDEDEEIAAQLRVAADRRQVERRGPFPPRRREIHPVDSWTSAGSSRSLSLGDAR